MARMSVRLETVNCDNCGSEDWTHLLSAHDPYLPDHEPFSVVRCIHCGLAFVNPRPKPDDLEFYYHEKYYEDRRFYISGNERVKRNSVELARLRRISRFRSTGNLLDVGCGSGGFLKCAADEGWNTLGVEVGKDPCRFARESLGLDVINASIDQADLPHEEFDVVTMWMVLEHLLSPSDAICKIWECLRPGGLLVVLVPNFASLQSKLFGHHWYALDLPRHLYHYTPKTIKSTLEKRGFRIRYTRWYAPEQDPGCLTASLRMRFGSTDILPGNEPPSGGQATAPLRRITRGTIRRIIPTTARICAAFHHSASMEVCALKI